MKPLDGIRVLDFSRLLPGPYCTMVMADLGADVIKVEEPGKGDYLRWMPPYVAGESARHWALNRGKRSVSLNIKHERGRDLFVELAKTADVVLESFRPGVMDRLGIGYADLKQHNKGLVYAAISGYGADSPYADRAGHDINYLGYAGALSMTGHPDVGPTVPGLQIGDIGGGGLMALVAILVALRVRDQTGEGQFCDVSMTDGAFSWLSMHAAAFLATGTNPTPGGDLLSGGFACYGIYECSDGKHLAVGALEPQFFTALTAAIGVPELAESYMEPARQPGLKKSLADVFATKTRDEWLNLLVPLEACIGPVNNFAEAFADESIRARGLVVDAALPDGTPFTQIGVVPKLSATPGEVGPPVSPLGGDTDALLAEIGIAADDIAQLRADGVV